MIFSLDLTREVLSIYLILTSYIIKWHHFNLTNYFNSTNYLNQLLIFFFTFNNVSRSYDFLFSLWYLELTCHDFCLIDREIYIQIFGFVLGNYCMNVDTWRLLEKAQCWCRYSVSMVTFRSARANQFNDLHPPSLSGWYTDSLLIVIFMFEVTLQK